MRVKLLFEGVFKVVAVLSGDDCPTEDFLRTLLDAGDSSAAGLHQMLKHVATCGLDQIPRNWSHIASQRDEVYEFIKGDFRLFYFKGKDGQIAVCTGGTRKSGQKADKPSVNRAAHWRKEYEAAHQAGLLILVKDDE